MDVGQAKSEEQFIKKMTDNQKKSFVKFTHPSSVFKFMDRNDLYSKTIFAQLPRLFKICTIILPKLNWIKLALIHLA